MLHNWCKDKNLSVENEFAEGSGGGQNVYAEDDSDLDDSDDDDSMAGDRKRKRTTNDIDMNQDFGSDESGNLNVFRGLERRDS